MVETWIPVTLAAAFLQNLRSALQKRIKTSGGTGRGKSVLAGLGTSGATFVRFAYGAPFALAYLAGLNATTGAGVPEPNSTFLLHVCVGGVAQILATWFLVALFDARSFAVATAWSKTETVQTAVFGIIVLAEPVSGAALLGILISLAGVVLISLVRSGAGQLDLRSALTGRPALFGLASGATFGIAAVSYRAASLSLADAGYGGGAALQAATTLAWVTVIQTLLMGAWLAWRERGVLTACLQAWRGAVWIGLAGVAASACWFTAMTLQNAAYVRALGQVELIFTFVASVFFFRERVRPTEVGGILLVTLGIVCLLLLR